MYPILILREEIVCFIILVFLAFISRAYRMGRDGRIFNRMLTFAMMHVIFDIYTVWTVNHTDTLPVINDIAHVIFYLSAILFANEFLVYTINLFYPEKTKKWHWLSLIPIGLYVLLLLLTVLKIEYEELNGTRASVGSAAIAGFGLAFLYLLISLLVLLRNWKKAGTHLRWILIPMLMILIAAEAVQIMVKEFLFTGGAITVITVAFFFTLENPRAVLERKAMMDALNGIGNRNTYEHDIEGYDAEFKKGRETPFIFLFADISNLRSINGLYGHQKGDEYITRMAVLLLNNLRGAEHLYRMGGDEFLAIYHGTDERTVIRDIRRVHEACRKESEEGNYTAELAMGYAVSDARYKSLRDVLRVADYMMYRNKADIKRDIAMASTQTGTHLNLTGLTDRVFDAMCLTSEEYYPFMTNLETGVTRLAPSLVEVFGLPDEFVVDFMELWQERVHPDDRKEFLEDVTATINGKKQYHYCQYRARTKDGEYVNISCRGGVYHGRDGEPDVFTGYMVNHGAPQVVDPATGLGNQLRLGDRAEEIMRSGKDAVIILLAIRNINRVKMLYGLNDVNILRRQVADTLLKILDGRGRAYSNPDGNYIICLENCGESEAKALFREIRETCIRGISVGDYEVPVGVSGGAVKLPNEALKTRKDVRSATMFALEESLLNQMSELNFFAGDESEAEDDEVGLLRQIHSDCIGKRDHFYLRYQPIVEMQTGQVTGAEALLRWKSPEGEEIGPLRFINFLENDPGYAVLGYDIIRTAVKEAKKIGAFLPDFNVNVNITALQLHERDFIDRVMDILKETGLEPKRLILELTERCKEMDFGILKGKVEALRAKGIGVALDDMGTGFSTIDLLLHLPVDEIKLDFAFTRDLRNSSVNVLYAKTLCRAASEGSTMVCFEGIENADTWEYLKGYGALLGQGYHFDRPLKAEEFEAKYCKAGE